MWSLYAKCTREISNLLLTDMVLPRVSGREIAKRASVLRPGIKILYMSGYTDDALIHRHGFDPAFCVSAEAVLGTALAAKVREVLDSDGFQAH